MLSSEFASASEFLLVVIVHTRKISVCGSPVFHSTFSFLLPGIDPYWWWCLGSEFLGYSQWKASMPSASAFVSIRTSYSYIGIIVGMLSLPSFTVCLILVIDAFASCFLLAISLCVSSINPRYLHFFQASSSLLLILYSSVLLWFIARFLCCKRVCVFALMASTASSLLELTQHIMSSAYCKGIKLSGVRWVVARIFSSVCRI